MTMYSVDVYSGSSDSIIQDSHAQAVIVKATQGTGYVNPKCNHQVELAKSLGKKLGYYHYAGGGDPVAEADYFIDNISGYVGTGMLIIDWEGYQNSAFGNTTWVRRFVDRVHDRTGVWCVIYVSESALAQVANCANDCGVWVAKYASMNWNSWTVPNMAVSSGAFKFITGWQYTGLSGTWTQRLGTSSPKLTLPTLHRHRSLKLTRLSRSSIHRPRGRIISVLSGTPKTASLSATRPYICVGALYQAHPRLQSCRQVV